MYVFESVQIIAITLSVNAMDPGACMEPKIDIGNIEVGNFHDCVFCADSWN